jgi:predicted Zn-dependent peptidase
LYYVTDTSKLNAAAGYTEFKAGIAVSADSANKLAVSHNINGTAFNGTASITTANWGKPRLLQIGNTIKAIGGSNGAATIEFSDAYAQANQSSHTKYAYTVDEILQSSTTIATSTAWSTTYDSGIYLVYGSSTAAALSGTSKPAYNYNNDTAANN